MHMTCSICDRYSSCYFLSTDRSSPTLPGTCKNGAACRFVHVEAKTGAKTGAKTARMVRVGKLVPSRGQDCGLAPMDVATGVAGEAKIQKRRPRASRGRAKAGSRAGF